MKAIVLPALLIAAALSLNSCDNIKKMNNSHDGDDAYYSLKDAKWDRAEAKKKADELKAKQDAEAAQRLLDQQTAAARSKPGSDYYSQPFDYDDYYDGEYAARLRHFDHPISGCGYYDNYYTNSYFYNQNPYYYGTSIYNGYNFWGPSYYAYTYCPYSYWMYNSGWGWGTGLYCGWNQPWGNWYDPWNYNPWNQWSMPMGSYWYPYGIGLGYGYGYNMFGCNPYYGNTYNNYYYNSNDQNSQFYGPRHSPSSTDGRVAGSGGPTFGERFMSDVAAEHNLAAKDVDNTSINRLLVSDMQSASNNNVSSVSRTNVSNDINNTTLPASGSTSGSTVTNRSTTVPDNPNTYNSGNATSTYSRPANVGTTSGTSSSTYTRPSSSGSSGTYSSGSSGTRSSSSSGTYSSGSSSRPSSSSGSSSSGGSRASSGGGSVSRPR